MAHYLVVNFKAFNSAIAMNFSVTTVKLEKDARNLDVNSSKMYFIIIYYLLYILLLLEVVLVVSHTHTHKKNSYFLEHF